MRAIRSDANQIHGSIQLEPYPYQFSPDVTSPDTGKRSSRLLIQRFELIIRFGESVRALCWLDIDR
jgi:hypothetical protein